MADGTLTTKLVFSILKFLDEQKGNGSLTEDAVESLEVAIQCLESAYGVSVQDESNIAQFQASQSLMQVFNQAEENSKPKVPTAEQLAQAEEVKNKGNDFMKAESYDSAIECYTQAIDLASNNAVYYCNRAAALNKIGEHRKAIEDCNSALRIDPNYSKAYGRKGLALTALGKQADALDCYKLALELDPENLSYKANLEVAQQKQREFEEDGDHGISSRRGCVRFDDMMGGGGGMPGGMPPGMAGMPGMPPGMDFTSFLSNPALMNMATQMMSSPQMQQMMSGLMGGAAAPGPAGPEGPAEPEGGGGGPGGLSTLLAAGQQLAEQMRESNPELVEQLREQMRTQNVSEEGDQAAEQPPPSQ